MNVLSIVDKSNNHNLDTKWKSRAYGLVVMTSPSYSRCITSEELTEYLNIGGLSGITVGHLNEVRRALIHYFKYIDYKIDKTKCIE